MIDSIQTGPFGVNTYIVSLTDSVVFVVDPAAGSCSGDGDKIVSYLRNKKLKPCAVILTHGHFDHVLGINIIKDNFPDIPILIHKADARMIGSSAVMMQSPVLEGMELSFIAQGLENLYEADGFLTDGLYLDSICSDYIKDEKVLEALREWKIIHTSGHTAGSICLYNKTKGMLISGDTVFFQSYGRTDLPGGSEGSMVKSLRLLHSSIPGETKVYPGHGSFGFCLEDNIGCY